MENKKRRHFCLPWLSKADRQSNMTDCQSSFSPGSFVAEDGRGRVHPTHTSLSPPLSVQYIQSTGSGVLSRSPPLLHTPRSCCTDSIPTSRLQHPPPLLSIHFLAIFSSPSVISIRFYADRLNHMSHKWTFITRGVPLYSQCSSPAICLHKSRKSVLHDTKLHFCLMGQTHENCSQVTSAKISKISSKFSCTMSE